MMTYLILAWFAFLFLVPSLSLNSQRLLYKAQVKRLSNGKAEITLKPGWLGKILRRPVRVGFAKRFRVRDDEYGDDGRWGWFWEADGDHVGEHIENYIRCAPLLAIEDIPIEKLLTD